MSPRREVGREGGLERLARDGAGREAAFPLGGALPRRQRAADRRALAPIASEALLAVFKQRMSAEVDAASAKLIARQVKRSS